ncbi:hypothetical protein THRCLA_11307 [Thraustotheca clavata]|uniref:Cytochrome P450 n=1 Tax=Thraustotheca clavata TaxID=74557 RepID=A0A1V9Y858_9STRA|nr:hypothetical protein THRCLA_11307 [Thraustotheca clavata]
MIDLGYATAVLPVFGVACFAIVSFFVYILVIAPLFNPLNALPGPPPSIITGNANELSVFDWDENNPFPSVHLQWLKQYGQAYHCRILGVERLTLADPDALKYVLVTNAKHYPRHILSRKVLESFTDGFGLLSSEDPLHASQRKLFNPHFASAKLRAFVDVFKLNADVFAKCLESIANTSSVIDMHDMVTKLSFDIIGMAAFGHNFNSQNGFSKDILEAYDMLNMIPQFIITFGLAFVPGFEKLPLPFFKKRREAKKILYKVVDDVIARKLKAPPSTARDLLDLMLDSGDIKVTPEHAKTHVLTFLFAGHETTSSQICWLFTVLAKNPDIEQKIVDELKTVTEITWESVSKLKYLTAVIYETMRVHPAVMTLMSRQTTRDDYLPMADGKQVFVPKVTKIQFTLSLFIAACNRNPNYWTEPDKFIPERFIEGSQVNLADADLRQGRPLTYIYFPFSIGPKQCIGYRFSFAEIQVVLATILPKYSFKLHSTANTDPCITGVTVKPKKLAMTCTHRL